MKNYPIISNLITYNNSDSLQYKQTLLPCQRKHLFTNTYFHGNFFLLVTKEIKLTYQMYQFKSPLKKLR